MADEKTTDHAARVAELDGQIARINAEAAEKRQALVVAEAERDHAEALRQLEALKADHDAAADGPAKKALRGQLDQHQARVDVLKARVDALSNPDDTAVRDRAAGRPQPEVKAS